ILNRFVLHRASIPTLDQGSIAALCECPSSILLKEAITDESRRTKRYRAASGPATMHPFRSSGEVRQAHLALQGATASIVRLSGQIQDETFHPVFFQKRREMKSIKIWLFRTERDAAEGGFLGKGPFYTMCQEAILPAPRLPPGLPRASGCQDCGTVKGL
ncbi:hypothetical protein AURANDRAFT_68900, partial [Aureococcus anophagefferens]